MRRAHDCQRVLATFPSFAFDLSRSMLQKRYQHSKIIRTNSRFIISIRLYLPSISFSHSRPINANVIKKTPIHKETYTNSIKTKINIPTGIKLIIPKLSKRFYITPPNPLSFFHDYNSNYIYT